MTEATCRPSVPHLGLATEAFEADVLFVKNAVSRAEAKTSDKWDIVNAHTTDLILTCREDDIGVMSKVGRFMGGRNDAVAAFNYKVCAPNNTPVLRVKRGTSTFSLGGAPVEFFDHTEQPVATMKKVLLTLGKKFRFEKSGVELFTLAVKSHWTTADFSINNQLVGTYHRKWDGPNADFFRKYCDFAFTFAPETKNDRPKRLLLLGFVAALRRIQQA